MTALDKVAALRPKAIAIPKDAFSRLEYQQKFHLNSGPARRELDDLVATGKLKTAIGHNKSNGKIERKFWTP